MKRILFAVAFSIIGFVAHGCKTSTQRSQIAATGTQDPAPRRDRVVYFHWDSVEMNSLYLRNAGYAQPDGHETHLNTAPSGELLDQYWTDYNEYIAKGGRSGLKGPGLYVSRNPDDSSTYGQDLLVLEVRSLDGREISDESLHSEYAKSNELISFDRGTYRIIRRMATNADGVRIFIRPPAAGDAEAYFQTIASDKSNSLGKRIKAVTDFLQSEFYKTTKTGTTKEFFAELVFNNAIGFYVDAAKRDYSPTTRAGLSALLTTSHLFLPDDPRTGEVALALANAQFIADQIRPSNFKDVPVEALSVCWEQMGQSQKDYFSQKIRQGISEHPGEFPASIDLLILAAKWQAERPEDPGVKQLRDLIKSRILTGSLFVTNVRPNHIIAAEQLFGDPPSQGGSGFSELLLELNVLKSRIRGDDAPYTATEFKDFVAPATEWWRKAMSHPRFGELLSAAELGMESKPALVEYYVGTQLAAGLLTNDAAQKAAILDSARRISGKTSGVFGPSVFARAINVLIHLKETNPSSPLFLPAIVDKLLRDIPSERMQIVKTVNETISKSLVSPEVAVRLRDLVANAPKAAPDKSEATQQTVTADAPVNKPLKSTSKIGDPQVCDQLLSQFEGERTGQ